MADTDIPGEGQPEALEPDDTQSAEAEAPKKTTTKKKVAKKKTAKKKVVAKKAARKKTAKKVAKAAAPASEPASQPQPVWDDDQAGGGVLDLVVQFGPVLILVILMLVLSGGDEQGTSAALPNAAPVVSSPADVTIPLPESMMPTSANLGAIELPSSYEPWAAGLDELLPSAGLPEPGTLTDGADTMNWDDPGAFYWGPTAVDEIPPAPAPSN